MEMGVLLFAKCQLPWVLPLARYVTLWQTGQNIAGYMVLGTFLNNHRIDEGTVHFH